MNRRLPAVAGGLIAVLLSAPIVARETALPAERLAWLDSHREQYTRAMLGEKSDEIAAHYSEQGRLMPPYHASVFGRANARTYHATFFDRFDVRKYQRVQTKAFDLGSRLIEVGRYTMTLDVSADGGASHEINGGYMDIWEQTAGKYSLLTHIWNTDSYPAIANELRLSNVPGVRTALEAHVPIKDDLSFELAALNALHEDAIVQADDKVWSMFFANDAVLLANHHGLVLGRAAIEEYLARHVKDLSVFEKLDIRNDAIDRAGRYVIEYASHVANWRNGDSSGVNTGKNIRLWRREPDGFLKVICGIGSYD